MLSNVSCWGRVTRSFVGYLSHKTYTCQYCNVSSLTLQLTSDIMAIYTDGPTVPHHAQHCDGQWLILDSYCASFKLLCHMVRMRVLTSNSHIANDTWPDAHYRIAVRASPDAHCVIALWRRIGFLMELLVTGKSVKVVWQGHLLGTPAIRHIHVKIVLYMYIHTYEGTWRTWGVASFLLISTTDGNGRLHIPDI